VVATLKTIKEIAENVGVSKTSIYNLIQRHKIKTVKQQGVTCVDEVGERLIVGYYSSEKHETLNCMLSEAKEESCSFHLDSQDENYAHLANYRHFIDVMEEELREKNEIIKGLIQTLTAEKINESRRLLIQEGEQRAVSRSGEARKKGFFGRKSKTRRF
jgi:excisionase family DNA binding protein